MTHLAGAYPDYAPGFDFRGARYVADALGLFPIPTSRLGPVVGSLTEDDCASAVIAAIDRVVSTARA